MAGIILTCPAAVMDALKKIKEYAVPVALGTGLIGGLSLIAGKIVGFLKLRKLQESFPWIREGEREDDWLFRKMPSEVYEEHHRKLEEEKREKAKG